MKLHTILLATVFSLTSCVMDYEKDNRSSRDYRTENDRYNRYDGQYSGSSRSGGYQSARERVLAGTYGTQQQSVQQQVTQTPKVEKKEEGWVDPNRSIARKYPIGNVPYEEIEPLLRKQLSSDGGLSYIHRFNSILVLDKPANHEKVKAILEAVVRDAVNIRVDLEFANSKAFQDFGITVKHSGIRIDNGGVHLPKRADVNIRDINNRQDTNTRQFLTTLSGHPAQLWVTQTVVDKQLYQDFRFIPLYNIGGAVVQPVQIGAPATREVGASLYMKPIYTDDGLVVIELFPVITTEINGKRQSFRVEKVQTTVTARPGQRVFLGGMNKQMNNFFSSIFNPVGAGKSRLSDIVNIYVTPTVMKVGPRK